jgi:hypothetical protein
VAVGAVALGVALSPSLAAAQQDQNDQGQQQQQQGIPENQGNQGNQGMPNQGNQGQGNQGQGNQGQGNQGQGNQGQPGNQGQQGNQGQPGNEQPTETTTAQTTNATLRVNKVDKATHTITFDDPRGGTFQVKAGPDINLDQVKQGQMLDVTYYQEIAMSVTKQGQAAPMVRQTTTNRGGVTAKQSTITAQVVSVDHDNNTVRVKGPNNAMHTIEVTDPNVQQTLNNVRPGDNVTITYTQAVAVAAQPHQT